MDFFFRSNFRSAIYRGKGIPLCPDCGYRCCTCQMSIKGFDPFEVQRSKIIQASSKNFKIKKDKITKLSINKWGL